MWRGWQEEHYPYELYQLHILFTPIRDLVTPLIRTEV